MLVLTVQDCLKVVRVSCEVLVLTVQDCIKVVRVSCECLY